jgi:hypothetical protein
VKRKITNDVLPIGAGVVLLWCLGWEVSAIVNELYLDLFRDANLFYTPMYVGALLLALF